MCTKDNDFFRLFTFNHSMYDAADFCIIYYQIKITKTLDIHGNDDMVLRDGDEYHECVFNLKRKEFSFCSYGGSQDSDEKGIIHPYKSLVIKQDDLAPRLKW